MKHIYTPLFSRFVSIVVVCAIISTNIYSQCPNSQPGGTTAFDTTIITPNGVTAMQLKFPQFDPSSGLVTCVKLCISITGVIDSAAVENNSTSNQAADIFYIRSDQITGPGLLTPMSNNVNQHYGSYILGPTDGTFGSGTDFVSIAHDTVLNAVQMCVTISDSTMISQFYGTDSVTYNYNISALTSIVCGGSYNSFISTSAFARFRFEYCTCPSSTLPLNIRSFNVKKMTDDRAELTWSGFDNPHASYNYEIEMSRNGDHFTTVGKQSKDVFESNGYKFFYDATSGSGTYYFRIKQVYSNGYVRFTEIKAIDLVNAGLPKINIYPNPSDGVVGIKFVNNYTGKFIIQISNTQGQTVFNKEVEIFGDGYKYVTTLQRGMYWLRLIDVTSHLSSVNQLLIK